MDFMSCESHVTLRTVFADRRYLIIPATEVCSLVGTILRRKSAHAHTFGGDFELKIPCMCEFLTQICAKQPANLCISVGNCDPTHLWAGGTEERGLPQSAVKVVGSKGRGSVGGGRGEDKGKACVHNLAAVVLTGKKPSRVLSQRSRTSSPTLLTACRG